jgi:WD repeat-containing protein 21A
VVIMSPNHPPDLPGFYYDPERKRYFRIVNTGQASSGSMSDYSISAVAEVRRRKTRARRNPSQKPSSHSLPKRRPSILKRHMLSSSLAPRVNKQAQEQLLMSGLSCQMKWSIDLDQGDSLQCLLWHPSSRNLLVGSRSGTCLDAPLENLVERPSISRPRYELPMVLPFHTPVTALCSSGRTIVNSCLGGPGTPGSVCVTWQENKNNQQDSNSVVYKLPGRQSVWSAAVYEDSRGWNSRVCVGSSTCAYLLEPEVTGFYKMPFQTDSDVFAVDFVGPEGKLIAAGCRNGMLSIFDPRVGTRHLTAAQPVLSVSHPSAISNLKMVDNERYVLASGLEDTLAMYDLRYIRPSRPVTPRSPYVEGHRNVNASSSQPCVEYKGYSNLHTIRHGFAIREGSKSFAVGCDDGAVKVYDIWSGSDITGQQLMNHNFPCTVAGLQWTSAAGLFIGFGTSIEYWAWSKLDSQLR